MHVYQQMVEVMHVCRQMVEVRHVCQRMVEVMLVDTKPPDEEMHVDRIRVHHRLHY